MTSQTTVATIKTMNLTAEEAISRWINDVRDNEADGGLGARDLGRVSHGIALAYAMQMPTRCATDAPRKSTE